MNRTQALAKLRPIFGKKLHWREDPLALAGEAREAAEIERRALVAASEAAKKARQARYEAILEGDAEYQRLKAEAHAAYMAVDKASGMVHRRRISVGTIDGILGAFWIKQQGDNWQEVVDALTRKKEAA
jgi:hypothetical protein